MNQEPKDQPSTIEPVSRDCKTQAQVMAVTSVPANAVQEAIDLLTKMFVYLDGNVVQEIEAFALLERHIAGLREELSRIDAVMARRPALDKPTRAENIEHAIATAARADKAEQTLSAERAAHEQTKRNRRDLAETLLSQKDNGPEPDGWRKQLEEWARGEGRWNPRS